MEENYKSLIEQVDNLIKKSRLERAKELGKNEFSMSDLQYESMISNLINAKKELESSLEFYSLYKRDLEWIEETKKKTV